jgi:membrane-associated protein
MQYIIDIIISAGSMLPFISFLLLVLSGLNLPISEDIVVIVSAAIASSHARENSVNIFIGCFLGAYTGDLIIYSIGRFAGRRILNMSLFKKFITMERIRKIEGYFDEYGGKTIFFGRFIPFGVRNGIFFTAGLAGMTLPGFLAYDFMALCITSAIQFSLGYKLGENYSSIIPYLNRYKLIILSILIIIIIVILLKKYVRAKR